MFENLSFLELFPIILFFVALFGLITSNNAIKSVIFVTVLNGAIIAFWIIVGSQGATTVLPPIMETAYHYSNYAVYMSDPVPQALMITAIVIGFAVTAVNIIILISLYRKYETVDWKTIIKLAKEDVYEKLKKEPGGIYTAAKKAKKSKKGADS
ncbi:MAG: cation:proton antiporter subunit C [Defluviitaleaceae bacterium]|nr:cation:proton antiporter subunit C [Defluviitaleaceae bacterium]